MPIPESISSRTQFKHKFSFCEMYRTFVFLPVAVKRMSGNNKSQMVDKNFAKRLQLAVTSARVVIRRHRVTANGFTVLVAAAGFVVVPLSLSAQAGD